MSLRFAYNTNGCANHRLYDAIELIGASGYDGVALTLDWHHLDPFADSWHEDTIALKRHLQSAGLGSVIETGARYLLDPRRKHEPTLVSDDAEGRARRIRFLQRAVEIADILESEAVSFWAGVPHTASARSEAFQRLVEGTAEVTSYAEKYGVIPAFEPEPGMAIETVLEFLELKNAVEELGGPLQLALDVGHLWVTGESDPAEAPVTYQEHIGTAAIEGMNRGIHIHLPFGEGDLDVPEVLRSFQSIRFDRLLCVELSRESPRAHEAVPQSIHWLKEHLS
ncbi:sugar phosphate isomerase/epimerase family protein [Parvularcula maris]|uniref:Sugar phosphate isomerase/epimerase n=1 Tax=Parvularcula maris TaxID=2965077 RepID=A0A9X2RJE8_9PROT|nr:sugar phosphate isomerase/epimerase family protein [Parvularcula maris]MCQ8184667.1 sugar phosphate isomerase/epimerase [Parvularcula maris]